MKHDGSRFWNQRRERFLFFSAMFIAFASLWWAGFRVGGTDDTASREPGLSHVHALGINPSDGSLFAATHHGAFRIAGDQPARRVGVNYQDLVGFAVTGPDRFVGSGHPDLKALADGAPRRSGLVESNNAGVTWKTISLRGAADFHSLAVAHDQIWGWESDTGRFMVTADRQAWDVRSTRPMLGFALDPIRADHVMAAGEDGLSESTDGGRTWSALAGPNLVALSWDAEAGVLGVEADGLTHRSTDGGATWRAAGRLPGEPQAVLATPSVFFAAADDGEGTAIYRSIDEGRTWRLRYRDGTD